MGASVHLTDGEQGAESVRIVDKQTALKDLLSGAAVLAPRQTDPPFFVIDHLAEAVEGIAILGPETNTSEVLAVLTPELFAYGIRQNLVAGHAVRWFPSGKRFMNAVQIELSDCSERPQDLFQQLSTVLRNKIGECNNFHSKGTIHPDDLHARRLFVGKLRSFDGTKEFAELPEDWYEFHISLNNLNTSMKQAVLAALATGRVLCASGTADRGILLPPSMATQVKYWSSKSDVAFCFSKDLPTRLVVKDEPLHYRRNRDGKWMIRADQYCAAKGKRISRTDLLAIACDKFGLSEELSDVLVDRLLSVPDETFPNGSLFRFLADRANNDVFQKVVSKDPTILARRMWSHGDAWLNPKFSVHARAASFGLLPDDCRDETARLLEEAALENLDLTFVEDEALISLIPAKDLFALGANVRMFIEEQIEDRISDIGSSADLDEDAESNFETVSEGLRKFEEVTELDVETDDPYLEARAAIDQEIENIQDQQEEKRKEEEESEAAEWVFAETRSSPPISPVSPAERPRAQRSIFDDIDR